MLLEHTIYQERKAKENYLMHYGIKGMKWDPSKRKYKTPDEMKKEYDNFAEKVESDYDATVKKWNDDFEAQVKANEEWQEEQKKKYNEKAAKVTRIISLALSGAGILTANPLMVLGGIAMFIKHRQLKNSNKGLQVEVNLEHTALKHEHSEDSSYEEAMSILKLIESMPPKEIVKYYKMIFKK